MKPVLVQLVYIIAAILFIFGLKLLSSVRSARRGNALASTAMLLAIIATLVQLPDFDPIWIVAGLVIGGAIGAVAARTVQMTAMPEMVAIFNGFGGGASVLVALSFLWARVIGPGTTGSMTDAIPVAATISAALSIIIGSVTFSGSGVAFAKLQGLITGNPILFKGQNAFNLLVALGTVALAVWAGFLTAGASTLMVGVILLTVITLLLGILLVIPIGGADMPVVISLLNSYSGLAACAAGFVVENNLLIIGGALVGASGLILTNIMCKAMNRSLANVLFGGFGAETATGSKNARDYSNIKQYGPEEAAMVMESASLVIIVPGYGLAVAQAQHACKEFADLLQQRGCEVRYAIHPVAGRMPGHMNVLLAEADVPYEQLMEMDQINPDFKNADVSLVLGANDVVNPAALDEPSSPIYGMPILNVHESRSVMVVKRSLSPGFAGIKNPLFERDNALMIFGDAKQVLQDLIRELRDA
jgi:NAD(P) transhydrogenase subunit beta